MKYNHEKRNIKRIKIEIEIKVLTVQLFFFPSSFHQVSLLFFSPTPAFKQAVPLLRGKSRGKRFVAVSHPKEHGHTLILQSVTPPPPPDPPHPTLHI